MKKILLIAFALFSASSFALTNVNVGIEKGSQYLFTKDAVELKEYFGELVKNALNEDIILDKVSIERKVIASNDVASGVITEYYYLLFSSFSKNLKVGVFLLKEGSNFILFPDESLTTPKLAELGKRYYISYGADEDSYPELVFRDQELRWRSAGNSCRHASGIIIGDAKLK